MRAWLIQVWVFVAIWVPTQHANAGDWGFRNAEAANLYNDGLASLDTGLTELARAQFERAAKLDKRSDLPEFGMGIALLHENKAEAADAVFVELKRRHQEADLWGMMVKSALAMSETELARARVEEAIGLYPSHAIIVQLYIKFQLNAENTRAAYAAIDTARSTEDSPVWSCLEVDILIEQRQIHKARQAMGRCEKAGPESQAFIEHTRSRLVRFDNEAPKAVGADTNGQRTSMEQWSKEIEGLMDRQQYAEALARLKLLIGRYPNNPFLKVWRARALTKTGALLEANEERKRVFQSGDYAEVWERGELMGVLSPRDQELHDRSIVALAIEHVIYNTEQSGLAEGERALALAESWRGKVPATEAARSYLMFKSGERQAGWAKLQGLLAGPWELSAKSAMGLLLEKLVVEDPQGVPKPVLAWMSQNDMWYIRYNRAADWFNAGQYGDCWSDLRSLQISDEALRRQFQELAYRCTIASEDSTGSAEALQQLGGVNEAPVASVLAHGWLLARQEAHTEGLQLIEGAKSSDWTDEQRAKQYALKMYLYVALEQIDAALAIADGSVPDTEFNLGVLLYNAGRTQEAQKVLKRTCPQASEALAPRCAELLNLAVEAQ